MHYYEVSSIFVEKQSGTVQINSSSSLPAIHLIHQPSRQTYGYSGRRQIRYLARSDFDTTEDTENPETANIFEETRTESLDLWSKFTMKCATWTGGRFFFNTLDPPVTLYTLNDALDFRPFVTRNTWSLERVFCRPPNSRYIAIVKGPAALTRAQIRSSLACSILGTLMILLVVISTFAWIGLPGPFIVFLFLVGLGFAWHALHAARRLVKVAKDLIFLKDEMRAVEKATTSLRMEPDSSHITNGGHEVGLAERNFGQDLGREKTGQGIFMVSRYMRVTQASETLCWIMLGVETFLFFIWPLGTLFFVRNNSLGLLFFAVASVTGIRHYINIVVAIEESGDFENVRGKDEQDRWIRQSRLSELVGAISGAKSGRRIWTFALGGFSLIFVGLFLGAVGKETEAIDTKQYTYLTDFYYPPLESEMRYPTCILSSPNNGIQENATMAEFVFLAGLAYRKTNVSQVELDRYYTNRLAIDDNATVEEFMSRPGNVDKPVSFKLIRFPNERAATIAIRGTATNWDLLADSQLWSASFLLQGSRLVLPLGYLWTPILDGKEELASPFESESQLRFSHNRFPCILQSKSL
jgi:hypothetical protein